MIIAVPLCLLDYSPDPRLTRFCTADGVECVSAAAFVAAGYKLPALPEWLSRELCGALIGGQASDIRWLVADGKIRYAIVGRKPPKSLLDRRRDPIYVYNVADALAVSATREPQPPEPNPDIAEAKAMLAQGMPVWKVAKALGYAERTIYTWRAL